MVWADQIQCVGTSSEHNLSHAITRSLWPTFWHLTYVKEKYFYNANLLLLFGLGSLNYVYVWSRLLYTISKSLWPVFWLSAYIVENICTAGLRFIKFYVWVHLVKLLFAYYK